MIFLIMDGRPKHLFDYEDNQLELGYYLFDIYKKIGRELDNNYFYI